MAYQFAQSPNHQYLRTASVPTFARELVVSLWFKPSDLTSVHTLFKMKFDDPDNNRFLLIARGTDTGDPVRWTSQNEGTVYSVDTTGAFLANTWNHVMACTNTIGNKLYVSLNGAAWDEVSGVKFPNGSPLYIQVGGNNAYLPSIEGSIAEVAIWNAFAPGEWMNSGHVGRLAQGFNAIKAVPGNRPLGYWRLLGEGAYQDIIGGRTLTPYNSPVGANDHPPIIG
jgi:hypothetical protein